MANLDPWSYAQKTNSEFAEQSALFRWANMAERFGYLIADDPNSYNVRGFAQTQFDNAGKLGYKHVSEPLTKLKWLHAIHNQGHGDAIRGAKAKAEGVKAGVADIFLPCPAPYDMWSTKVYHGFYIELKKAVGGKPSPDQLDFQWDVRNEGYKHEICHGWLEARKCILDYLGIDVS